MIHYITKFKGYTGKYKSKYSIQQVIEYFDSKKSYALDTETTGLTLQDKVVLIQIGDLDNQFIFDTTTLTNKDLMPLIKFLNNEQKLKVGHNLKFDYKMLRSNFGIEIENLYDTQIADEVIYNGLFNNLHKDSKVALGMYYKSFSLASTYKRYTNISIVEDKKLSLSFTKWKEGTNFTDNQLEYAANDLKYCLEIKPKQIEQIKKYNLTYTVKLEHKVVPVLGSIEFTGIKIDVDKWKAIINGYTLKYNKVLNLLEDYIVNQVGNYKELLKHLKDGYQLDMFGQTDLRKTIIKWNSPKEVLKICNILGIKIKNTNAGTLELVSTQDTTSRNIGEFKKLNKIENWGVWTDKEIFIEVILILREYDKVLTTYGESFLELVNTKTGRVHPNFKQCYPETGRLSCDSPNLQNIKAEGEFRELFIADKGQYLSTADYSSAELRIIAELSQDKTFIKAFKNDEDVHSTVATLMYSKKFGREFIVTKKNENKEYRTPAKNLNFMLAYGGGADKLMTMLGVNYNEAVELIQLYYKTFPAIKKSLDESAKFAKYNGYSITLPPAERIRWYKDHAIALSYSSSGDNQYIARIERQGKNARIQGCNADITKLALVYIHQALKGTKGKIVNTVHDEIVCEFPKSFVEEGKKIQHDCMIKAAQEFLKTVPMKVELTVSKYWQK